MSVPEPNEWFHAAFFFNGTLISGYVNGIPVDPVSNGDSPTTVVLPDQPVMLYGKRTSAGSVNGNYSSDDIFVFPYALDQSDLDSFQ